MCPEAISEKSLALIHSYREDSVLQFRLGGKRHLPASQNKGEHTPASVQSQDTHHHPVPFPHINSVNLDCHREPEIDVLQNGSRLLKSANQVTSDGGARELSYKIRMRVPLPGDPVSHECCFSPSSDTQGYTASEAGGSNQHS